MTLQYPLPAPADVPTGKVRFLVEPRCEVLELDGTPVSLTRPALVDADKDSRLGKLRTLVDVGMYRINPKENLRPMPDDALLACKTLREQLGPGAPLHAQYREYLAAYINAANQQGAVNLATVDGCRQFIDQLLRIL